ncbi:hypothetical protein P7C73_g1080, partial [Tremellales sp. Uapishka_1]
MPRATPNAVQNILSSVIVPLLSIFLLPVSLTAVALCIAQRRLGPPSAGGKRLGSSVQVDDKTLAEPQRGQRGCVIISGGRMAKSLTLARAFKRAGWQVIGVEEEGYVAALPSEAVSRFPLNPRRWGELCPLRFSSAVSHFYLLPPTTIYPSYASTLRHIAQTHSATLFIPVSGAGSSVEDSRAAQELFDATQGRCRTFVQDEQTMLDLHDKDRFINLVKRLGMIVPKGRMVNSVDEAMEYMRSVRGERGMSGYLLKCMGLDENRGDMTLFPLEGDGEDLKRTDERIRGLKLPITKECPYVFQEFIPGQEHCTHASVVDGRITSFVTCPSNDMLMTYTSVTSEPIGRRSEQWTQTLLDRLASDPTSRGEKRSLTGHFSFDFIQSDVDGEFYPLECNARVHTAVILLPLDRIASCYESVTTTTSSTAEPLRPIRGTVARTWWYNDLIMRYLPSLVPSHLLPILHPSLLACAPPSKPPREGTPGGESLWAWRVEPTLVADDWVPFLVLWHIFWPYLLVSRWWKGKKWTRLNVSTGRIFEA